MGIDHAEIRSGMQYGMTLTLGSAGADQFRDVLDGSREPRCEYELGVAMGYGESSLAEAYQRLASWERRRRESMLRAAQLEVERAEAWLAEARRRLAALELERQG